MCPYDTKALLGHTDAIQAMQIKSIQHLHDTSLSRATEQCVFVLSPVDSAQRLKGKRDTPAVSHFHFHFSVLKIILCKVSCTLVFYAAFSKCYLSTLNAFSLAKRICSSR